MKYYIIIFIFMLNIFINVCFAENEIISNIILYGTTNEENEKTISYLKDHLDDTIEIINKSIDKVISTNEYYSDTIINIVLISDKLKENKINISKLYEYIVYKHKAKDICLVEKILKSILRNYNHNYRQYIYDLINNYNETYINVFILRYIHKNKFYDILDTVDKAFLSLYKENYSAKIEYYLVKYIICKINIDNNINKDFNKTEIEFIKQKIIAINKFYIFEEH